MGARDTKMSLVLEVQENFQHIIRVSNTNVDGSLKIYVAMTAITGLGKRLSILACKRADVDPYKRAGSCSKDEIDRIVQVMQDPGSYKIPEWMFNRRQDYKTGKNMHVVASDLNNAIREDLERLKKIRCNRGLRHHWGIKVRGQHTKTTGRGVAAVREAAKNRK